MLCVPIKINPVRACAFCCTSCGALMPAGKWPPLGKGKAQGPQQAAHVSMSRGCQGQKGGKRWEKVLWLLRALNSHCNQSFGKHTLSVDTDFSTGWPGGVGRGRAKVFCQEGCGRALEVPLKGHWWQLQCPGVQHPIQLSVQQAQDQLYCTKLQFRTFITALT